jgi:PAS domain S-box-containing protein
LRFDVDRRWVQYAVALACVAVATAARAALYPVVGPRIPYATFFPAVILASIVGGWGPGVLALGLSALAASVWIPPAGTLKIGDPLDVAALGTFLTIGLVVVGMGDRIVRTRNEARRAGRSERQAVRRESEAYNRITDGFVATDAEFRYTHVNPAAERFLHTTAAEMLGRNVWEVFPQSVGTAYEQEFRRAMREQRPVEFETSAATAPDRTLHVRAFPAPDGLSIHFRDVTDLKRSEEARATLAAIVESSDDAIIGKSLDGTIRTWNDGARRLYGYEAHEVIGKPITILLPPDRVPEEDQILERIRRGERVEHFETQRLAKDGRVIDVSLTVSPIRDSSGRVIGASKIARDITERKAAREALLAGERAARAEAERVSRMKDEFLATLSHELRTPLNAILGWAQILRASEPTPGDLGQGLETIERNARLQAQLIEDLLDMSRIISGKVRLDVQRVDLSAVIDAAVETVRPAAEAKGVRMAKLIDPHAGPVRGDPNRLQQVVWNLLSNAIKFTPRGGRVEVALERVNSNVEITVSDTGVGISPDFLPYVFERFRQADASSTRRHGGLGLGLSIVKHLAELHGGTVRARSAGEGKGASFIVHLPLSPARIEEPDRHHPTAAGPDPAAATRQDAPSLEGLKVLVVDDEPDARLLVARILSDHRAEVVTTASADEALPALQRERPQVLISDIGMPEVDGYELMRRVRSMSSGNGGAVPAVALTAFARPEDRLRALHAGYQMHVAKPVEPAELVAVVASLAGRLRSVE